MYWDDSSLIVVPYDRKRKSYYCGRKLEKIKTTRKLKYKILIIDLSEAYCANVYDDGEIEKLFNIESSVSSKHKAGGQSQRRFERIREGSITEWYKRINRYLTETEGDLYVGINFIYQSRFEGHLSLANKNRIVEWDRPEYSGYTGITQYINKLNKR